MSWQKQWQESFKNVDSLLSHLQLSTHDLPVLKEKLDFPILVPRAFAERMQKTNPRDPLLLQVLPLAEELKTFPGYSVDPLAENDANPLPGLLHKYKGRVLLTLSGACAVNCRYCFRRHFPYKENNPGTKGWELIFDYLNQHPEVSEVILSGGDPLSISDVLLEAFIRRLETIPTIKYLRFHTRLPIVIPDRITSELITLLNTSRFRVTMVLHSNHANEWNDTLKLPMQKLKDAGITLLNQAVLLRDINDNAQSLIDLSYRLYDYGVLPYYLHLLDKVSGAAHFDVSQTKAVALMHEMIETLPGYLVPKLVREIPHRASKVPVNLKME